MSGHSGRECLINKREGLDGKKLGGAVDVRDRKNLNEGFNSK